MILTFEGAPVGAAVSAGGKEIGYVPSVELERGDSPVVVTLTLDGFFPTPIKVMPDQDQTLKVAMKKKQRPSGGARSHKDDLIPWPKDK